MTRRSTPSPHGDPDVARLGAVLADPSRVAMLDTLLDGDAHAIGALARKVGITPATASGHLRRLLDERLVTVTRKGRENRVRLASPAVAHLLEAMARLAAPAPTHTTMAGMRARELRFARTCYDHLAGVLGVRVTQALIDLGWMRAHDGTFAPKPALFRWLAEHGSPFVDDPRVRRPLTRACIDWSERTPHLAGRMGAAIAELFVAQKWVVRVRDTRTLRVTDRGRDVLADQLAIRL